MAWSNGPPASPGHYWWRRHADGQELPVRLGVDGRVYDTYGGSVSLERMGGEWGPALTGPGPDVPPADAAEQVARALEDAARALRALGAGLRDGRAEQ